MLKLLNALVMVLGLVFNASLGNYVIAYYDFIFFFFNILNTLLLPNDARWISGGILNLF